MTHSVPTRRSSDLRSAVQIVECVAREDVFAVAVTILCLKGDARGKQSRNDGAADRAFGDDLIIVADAEAGVAGEIIRRAARRYVDRAAGRIAPIKRALRSTQQLDLLDIVEARQRGDRA